MHFSADIEPLGNIVQLKSRCLSASARSDVNELLDLVALMVASRLRRPLEASCIERWLHACFFEIMPLQVRLSSGYVRHRGDDNYLGTEPFTGRIGVPCGSMNESEVFAAKCELRFCMAGHHRIYRMRGSVMLPLNSSPRRLRRRRRSMKVEAGAVAARRTKEVEWSHQCTELDYPGVEMRHRLVGQLRVSSQRQGQTRTHRPTLWDHTARQPRVTLYVSAGFQHRQSAPESGLEPVSGLGLWY